MFRILVLGCLSMALVLFVTCWVFLNVALNSGLPFLFLWLTPAVIFFLGDWMVTELRRVKGWPARSDRLS